MLSGERKRETVQERLVFLNSKKHGFCFQPKPTRLNFWVKTKSCSPRRTCLPEQILDSGKATGQAQIETLCQNCGRFGSKAHIFANGLPGKIPLKNIEWARTKLSSSKLGKKIKH